MSLGCKVCDDKAVCLTVDRYLDQGLSCLLISQTLTLGGWAVAAPTVSRHKLHYTRGVNPDLKPSRRDAAIIIKNRVLDALELVEERPGEWLTDAEGNRVYMKGGSILDKDLQPALGTALKAQALEDKRELAKAKGGAVQVLTALLAALRGEPVLLLEDGNMIEGDAVEVD